MTSPPDLPTFLLARIAEDKRQATAAAGGHPEWVDSNEETSDGENVYYTVTAKTGTTWEPDHFLTVYGGDRRDGDRAAHIARHDPARILAECEAKRRVVDAYMAGRPGDGLRRVLACLALPYADHPDYQEAWRV